MLQRHTNELFQMLERVADIGCGEVTNNRLLYWYNQDRVTIGIWKDINEKWVEILESIEDDPSTPLLVGEADGVWVFVYGGGLQETEKSWLKEVGKLSRRKNADNPVEASEAA